MIFYDGQPWNMYGLGYYPLKNCQSWYCLLDSWGYFDIFKTLKWLDDDDPELQHHSVTGVQLSDIMDVPRIDRTTIAQSHAAQSGLQWCVYNLLPMHPKGT